MCLTNLDKINKYNLAILDFVIDLIKLSMYYFVYFISYILSALICYNFLYDKCSKQEFFSIIDAHSESEKNFDKKAISLS